MQVAAKQRQRSSVDKALGYWRMMAASSAFRQWRETVWVSSLPCTILLRCSLKGVSLQALANWLPEHLGR